VQELGRSTLASLLLAGLQYSSTAQAAGSGQPPPPLQQEPGAPCGSSSSSSSSTVPFEPVLVPYRSPLAEAAAAAALQAAAAAVVVAGPMSAQLQRSGVHQALALEAAALQLQDLLHAALPLLLPGLRCAATTRGRPGAPLPNRPLTSL
jgi:hypothetical protein